MLQNTKDILETLKEDYNYDFEDLNINVVEDSGEKDVDWIIFDDGMKMYKVTTYTPVEDMASFIAADYVNPMTKGLDTDELPLEYTEDAVEEVAEALSDIKVDKIYKYKPAILGLSDDIEDKEDFLNESKLIKLAKYEPYCKVKDILIVSKEEEDGFVVVTFDIDENKDLNLPDFAKEDFVVFDSDLVPVDEEVKIKEDTSLISENETIRTNTSLLTALDSEKDAINIYESLLETVEDEEDRKLLEKILNDEKEHVALLAGLQSSKMANYVADDNKADLEDYAENTIVESSVEEN